MAKKKPKKKKKAKTKKQESKTNPEVLGLLWIALSLILTVSLYSFTFDAPKTNLLGYLGYFLSFGFNYLFGLSSYLVSVYFFCIGFELLSKKKNTFDISDHCLFFSLAASSSFLLTVFASSYPEIASSFSTKVITESVTFIGPVKETITRYNLGGIPFYLLYSDIPHLNLQKILSASGTAIIFTSLFFISLLLLTRMQIWALFISMQNKIKSLLTRPEKPLEKPTKIKIPSLPTLKEKKTIGLFSSQKEERDIPIITAKRKAPKELLPNLPKNLMVTSNSSFQVPPPHLLSPAKVSVDAPTLKKDLMMQAAVLEETLKSFGIDAKVGQIHSGPTITSFEVHPSIGVKVQKIKALENDIALNMQAKSIRIVAPIPGKAAVGVEVPNIHPQEVSFQEMLIEYLAKPKKLQIPVLLGKAINGDWVFSDLAKMPHLLIAGATGSGKSVCVNTIVMSILMNAKPDEVKLLMIDPKKVELTPYSRLPHMIAPVITEAHGAYAALQWLVKEMQVRYEILKQLGLRNISAFNNRKANKDLEESLNIPIPEHMPYIVAIVDEFADLMMVSSADIETPIARIAQMARAVGIHLILATQRPSREVITGIIKANIPTRISFKVASRINSQIILDDVGAESLLGNGDLLFLPPGTSQLIRAQGAYISDDDINNVIRFLTDQGEPNYLISSFDAFKALDSNEGSKGSGNDSLYEKALDIVVSSKNASTTFLQRKLKIGYARAAGLMDELEENGIVGAQDGSRARKVLSSGKSFVSDEDEALDDF